VTRFSLLGVFFVSGFATLIYQTIWQRMLALFGGADVYSVTIIVAAFMAGLGFGGLAGGHLADRLSRRARLWTFAACECGVGLFAMFSATLYYDTLYAGIGGLAFSRAAVAGITFGVTLIPTFLMGMSLPILAKLPESTGDGTAEWISRLYGWNTLGAAAGSFFAVMMLFRSFDLRMNLVLGAALSIGCGVAVLLSSRSQPTSSVIGRPQSLTPADSAGALPFRTWLMLYALSGFVSLSLEIVWLRLLGVMLKSSAMTFGYLLTLYLGGLGAGSLLAHNRVFSRVDATRMFFRLQAAVPIWAGISISLLLGLINYTDLADPLRQGLASTEPIATPGMVLVTHVVIPLFLIIPPTLMMGLSFGLLQRAVQTDSSLVGRRVGWLQAANILGATLGAIITGVVLLDALGSSGALRVLVGCGVVFLILTPATNHAFKRLAGIALVAGVIALIPNSTSMWAALHGGRAKDVLVGEDASGLIVFRQDEQDTKVFLGGISQSWIPYGGVHTALGALPSLLHPQPESIALIGLASGDTLFAIGGRAETQAIESLEIMAPQLPALGRVAQRSGYPALQILLADRRITHRNIDGRIYLRQAGARFDIVEADPLLPRSASAGNLYSVEYFRILKDALKPGGLAVTWLPTMRTVDTFASVFPHVIRFGDIGIGSLSPIAYDRETIVGRMNHPFTRHYFARGGIDLPAILLPYLKEAPLVPVPPADSSDLNRDLFPMDEFGLPYKVRSNR
jgi:spermidine synthase